MTFLIFRNRAYLKAPISKTSVSFPSLTFSATRQKIVETNKNSPQNRIASKDQKCRACTWTRTFHSTQQRFASIDAYRQNNPSGSTQSKEQNIKGKKKMERILPPNRSKAITRWLKRNHVSIHEQLTRQRFRVLGKKREIGKYRRQRELDGASRLFSC